MGMFDFLRCEYSLPDGFLPPDKEACGKDNMLCFQTKDTDCRCDYLLITKEGKLILEHEGLWPELELDYYNNGKYTGQLDFYTSGHSYRAQFTNGQLFSIITLSY